MQSVGQKRKCFSHNETLLETSSPGNQLTRRFVCVSPTPGKTTFPKEDACCPARQPPPSTPPSRSPSEEDSHPAGVAGSVGPPLPAGVERGAADPHGPRGTPRRRGRGHTPEPTPCYTLAGQSATGVGAASCWGGAALLAAPADGGSLAPGDPSQQPHGWVVAAHGRRGPGGTHLPGCPGATRHAAARSRAASAPPLPPRPHPDSAWRRPRRPPCRCASPRTCRGCSRSSGRCRRGWRRRRPPGSGRRRRPGRRAARPRSCGPRRSGRGCGSSSSTPPPVPPRPRRAAWVGGAGVPRCR